MRDTAVIHTDQGDAIEFAPLGLVQRDQFKCMVGIGEQAHVGDEQVIEIDVIGPHIRQHFFR